MSMLYDMLQEPCPKQLSVYELPISHDHGIADRQPSRIRVIITAAVVKHA